MPEYSDTVGIAHSRIRGRLFRDDQVNHAPPQSGDMRIFVFERKKQ